MAIWMEMRCEDRGGDNPGCQSDINNDPGTLGGDDQRSAIAAWSDLKSEAIAWGWKKFRDGWVCPVCTKRRQNTH